MPLLPFLSPPILPRFSRRRQRSGKARSRRELIFSKEGKRSFLRNPGRKILMGRNKTDKSDRNKETKESERGKENSKISILFESMDPKRKIKRSFNKNLNSRIRMFGSEDPLSPSSSSLKRRSKTMKTTVERDETKGIKKFWGGGEGKWWKGRKVGEDWWNRWRRIETRRAFKKNRRRGKEEKGEGNKGRAAKRRI